MKLDSLARNNEITQYAKKFNASAAEWIKNNLQYHVLRGFQFIPWNAPDTGSQIKSAALDYCYYRSHIVQIISPTPQIMDDTISN